MFDDDNPVAIDPLKNMMPVGMEALDQKYVTEENGGTYYDAGCGHKVELVPGRANLVVRSGSTMCPGCYMKLMRDM